MRTTRFPPSVNGAFMKHVTVLPATIVLGLCSLLVLAIPSWAADKDESDIEKRIDNSAKVGRQVKLTGSARATAVDANEKTTKEGQVEQASSKEEYRDLHVVAITMISETCTK